MKRDRDKLLSRNSVRGKTKRANRKRGGNPFAGLGTALPWFARISGVVMLACFCVFVHDAVTRTQLLEIRNIETHGLEQLQREEVLLQAAVPENASIYGIRLDHVRIRLEAHPFIREARLSRRLPDGLSIRIEERRPFAVLQPDLKQEKSFLTDADGRIFKELEKVPEAYAEYVVIHGLPLLGERENRFWFGQAKEFIALWNMEMAATSEEGPPLFLRVDPDLGLFVNHTELARQIAFGRSDYRNKMAMLKELAAFRQIQKNTETIDRIDFTGNNRIVLVPVPTEASPAT